MFDKADFVMCIIFWSFQNWNVCTMISMTFTMESCIEKMVIIIESEQSLKHNMEFSDAVFSIFLFM